MKSLGVLILGVVVGWAASGEDWSLEAEGQDAITESTKQDRDDRAFVVHLGDQPQCAAQISSCLCFRSL